MTSKPISKQALYSMISSRAKEIILRLVELTSSKNENVALGACKVLVNKVIPDIKSQDFIVQLNSESKIIEASNVSLEEKLKNVLTRIRSLDYK